VDDGCVLTDGIDDETIDGEVLGVLDGSLEGLLLEDGTALGSDDGFALAVGVSLGMPLGNVLPDGS